MNKCKSRMCRKILFFLNWQLSLNGKPADNIYGGARILKKKSFFLQAAAIGVFLITFSQLSCSSTESPTKTDKIKYLFPDKGSKPALEIAYQGPICFPLGFNEEEKIKAIAENFQVVITRHANPLQIQKLKRLNPSLQVLQYINIKGVKKRDLELPFYNAVEKKNIYRRDAYSKRIKNRHYNWYLVDIQNKDWSEALIDVLSKGNERYNINTYDGIMFDDTKLSWANSLTSEPAHHTLLNEYEGYHNVLKNIKKKFPKKEIVFNGYCQWIGNSDENKQIKASTGISFLDVADGISFETVTRNFQGKSYGEERILHHLKDFYTASKIEQKKAFFVEVGDHDDYKKRLFSVASYFLVHNEFSFYNYVAKDISDPLQLYPEYYLDLGKPDGMFFKENSIYKRNFQNAEVFVNMEKKFKTLGLFGEGKRIFIEGGGKWETPGKIILKETNATIEMPPLSAVILMK